MENGRPARYPCPLRHLTYVNVSINSQHVNHCERLCYFGLSNFSSGKQQIIKDVNNIEIGVSTGENNLCYSISVTGTESVVGSDFRAVDEQVRQMTQRVLTYQLIVPSPLPCHETLKPTISPQTATQFLNGALSSDRGNSSAYPLGCVSVCL